MGFTILVCVFWHVCVNVRPHGLLMTLTDVLDLKIVIVTRSVYGCHIATTTCRHLLEITREYNV